MKRNGIRIACDLRSDMARAVRHDAQGLRGARRDLDPSLTGDAARDAQCAALRELADELGVARHEVDLTLPRAEAIEKHLLLPQVAAHELEPLVRFQLAKDLPFDLDDLAVAWQVVPHDGDGVRVECVAIRRQVVEASCDLLRAAGLRPGRLIVATDAAARGLALASKAATGRHLLLDVHRGATDIVVARDGRVAFSRTSSLGPGADDWQARLAGELSRTLTAAEAQTGGPPETLTLAGAPAAELATLLHERLGLEPQPLDLAAPEAFMAARGLADPTPLPGPQPLDLANVARVRLARLRKQQGALIGVVVLVVALAVVLVANAQLHQRQAKVAALETERLGLAPKARTASRIRGELDLAERWTERKGRELEVLLAVTRALPGEDAYLTQLRWSENGDLQLGGRAKEWETVGAFFAALDRDPLVEAAAFADVRRPREKDARGFVFTGSARLRDGGAR